MITAKKRLLAAGSAAVALVGGGILCAALAGAPSGSGVAHAENAAALGNTLGGNDTAEKGDYTAYDPAIEAEHTGGEAIEGSEEEQLQQERIAGGAVGEVSSQNLPELDGVVNEDESDYVATYGMELQAPDLPQAIVDAVEGGSLEGLPKNHLDALLSPDDCASCHAIA